MRVCEYCGGVVGADDIACPHCSASSFVEKCDECGELYTGSSCPACAQKAQEAREAEEAERKRSDAVLKANTGLGWKTALTVFLPFIGGYYLLNNNVRKGYRTFAAIWCCFIALDMAFVSSSGVGAKVIGALACLAPVAVYLLRNKDELSTAQGGKGKLAPAALGAVLLVSLVGAVASPSGQPAEPAETSRTAQGVTATAPVVVAPVPANTSASASSTTAAESSSASAESSSSSAQAGPTAKDATLVANTKYLEYSNKETDATKLVTCNIDSAKVTADGALDLSKVGVHAVAYTIALGGETATQQVEFTVRDTKAPKISFVKAKPGIDVGDTFDPLDNMEYVKDKVDGELPYVEGAPEAQGTKPGLEEFYHTGWYTIEGSVDSSTPGTYALVVTASDRHGNVTTREMPVTVRAAAGESASQPATEEHTYIANRNSMKFHVPGCRDVSRMSEANKLEITATRDEMIKMGYSPCGHCFP